MVFVMRFSKSNLLSRLWFFNASKGGPVKKIILNGGHENDGIDKDVLNWTSGEELSWPETIHHSLSTTYQNKLQIKIKIS